MKNIGVSLDIFDGEHLYLSEPLGKGIRIISRFLINFNAFSVLGGSVVV